MVAIQQMPAHLHQIFCKDNKNLRKSEIHRFSRRTSRTEQHLHDTFAGMAIAIGVDGTVHLIVVGCIGKQA